VAVRSRFTLTDQQGRRRSNLDLADIEAFERLAGL